MILNKKHYQLIGKFKKIAKKNIFFKYAVAVFLFFHISIGSFFVNHKKAVCGIAGGGLLILVLLFTVSGISKIHSMNNPFPVRKECVVEEEKKVAPERVNERKILLTGVPAEDDGKDADGSEELTEKNREEVCKETEKKPQFSKNDWNLILINKNHPIPDDYQFTLGTIRGNMRCDERIIEPLTQMIAHAEEDGIHLSVCSPYRDMERQSYLFERKIKSYRRKGMSYLKAYQMSSQTVTVPGASEHQVGLAVDINCDSYWKLDEGFADTDAGRWLADHSWEHGFILRYPKEKEDITGIQYEPWHFRYVGMEAAEIIAKNKITLEEFIEEL